MVFSSLPFLFAFLPLCLICYFIVPFKYKNISLLIFSLIFYAWGEPIYILLMIFSSVVDYTNGRFIEKYQNDEAKKKIFLIASIVINLSMLGFFKYSGFFVKNLSSLFLSNPASFNVPLPIGISFYTFQTMSYSIDVYRGDVKSEHNFLNFMTYVCMFPQLIAGPIVRYKTISEELYKRNITTEDFSRGFVRFIAGLAKKVLLANNIGALYDSIITQGITSATMAWMAVIAFGFQIFFDFAGYSDMAIGIGRMLGFSYNENFDYPYTAVSITDFWRRWHISLSSFFKDYVYIPLGGSRVSKLKQIRNLMVVWLLTGFWHGANWNFILWGLYYGILLICEKFILKNLLEKLPRFLKHLYALFFVIIGWAIFAFEDISSLFGVLSCMFGLGSQSLINEQTLYLLSENIVIFIICVVMSTPLIKNLSAKKLNSVHEKHTFYTIARTLIYISLFILSVSFIVDDTFNPFLYFRF